MKKHTLILLTLSYSIIAIENATETMTVSTFFSNAWSGNITFRANTHIPIIEKDKKTFIIKGPGKFDDVTMACKVNKKNIFSTNSFFELWVKGLEEKVKNKIESEFGCDKCSGSFDKENMVVLTCCEEKEILNIICDQCNRQSVNGACFFCNQDLLFQELKEKDNSFLERIKEANNSQFECDICCNLFNTKDIVGLTCCATKYNLHIVCNGCNKSIVNGSCPYCNRDRLFQELKKIENPPIKPQEKVDDDDLTIFNMQDFRKSLVEEAQLKKDVPLYMFDKNSNMIQNSSNIYNKEDTRIADYIKPGAYFQAKTKRANKGRFLGISMNWERWHCFVPIFYSLTYCGLRSVADNDPESINAIKTTSLVGSLVLWLWVALWQKADYNKHKNKLVK